MKYSVAVDNEILKAHEICNVNNKLSNDFKLEKQSSISSKGKG